MRSDFVRVQTMAQTAAAAPKDGSTSVRNTSAISDQGGSEASKAMRLLGFHLHFERQLDFVIDLVRTISHPPLAAFDGDLSGYGRGAIGRDAFGFESYWMSFAQKR